MRDKEGQGYGCEGPDSGADPAAISDSSYRMGRGMGVALNSLVAVS